MRGLLVVLLWLIEFRAASFNAWWPVALVKISASCAILLNKLRMREGNIGGEARKNIFLFYKSTCKDLRHHQANVTKKEERWSLEVFCYGCKKTMLNGERFRLRYYDVTYFHQISFDVSFAADISYSRVVWDIRQGEYQLIHIRARLESYLRYAVNAPPSRCLSARSLFHCASNLGARIGSAVFRQIPPPILPRPAHLLYIYDSEETTRYLVACDARSNKVNRGPGQYRLPCIFYFKDNYFKE